MRVLILLLNIFLQRVTCGCMCLYVLCPFNVDIHVWGTANIHFIMVTIIIVMATISHGYRITRYYGKISCLIFMYVCAYIVTVATCQISCCHGETIFNTQIISGNVIMQYKGRHPLSTHKVQKHRHTYRLQHLAR